MGNLKHGWIKLDRAIQSHWLWSKKPYDKARAWIDLILMANYEERKTYIGNTLQIIRPGEIVTSIAKLSISWGWDKKTVKRFLKLLEADNMLTVKSTNKWTTISLINYEKYQNDGSAKSTTEGTSKRTTKSPQMPQQSHIKRDTMEERYKKDIRNKEIKEGATVVPSEQGLPNEDDEWVNSEDIELPEVIE